ncbi:PaaX family transcriptional regulator [Acuticoccus mangrovi]|uniref:PaaX family transcriptional regulator n=1 Tax=Acuticoccus mangrovi TaxID=2796142 RepID=A0A934IQI5_9HYPH|nr:PaaX family transcriptional regulator C-terminal domain-containing protein [Acuticoccus mangrovi]MBJ3776205.1 hypothetical protein [Acuticoccus mangrovi]
MRDAINRFSDALDTTPVRAWSLIVSIYGDCVMPRGGELWLGTLTELLAALDVEPGSTRTAMSRLARDGFLERHRVGRTSHYRLSGEALALSRRAERLIYRTTAPTPPPGWEMVVTLPPGAADRKQLARAGYAALVPGVYARPHADDAPPPPDAVIRLTATGDDAALATALYPLADIAARYHGFITATAQITPYAEDADPLQALALRIMLVHGFRRIVLRDPHLSRDARPADWPADAAYRAFATLYRRLEPLSDSWLDDNAQNAAGPLPKPDDARRFCDPTPATVDM